jgi:hypothetical protein
VGRVKLVLKDELDREEVMTTMSELFAAIAEFLAWVDRDKWHRVTEETTRLAEAYAAMVMTLCEEVAE